MLVKRLSTVLCVIVCLHGIILGNTKGINTTDANITNEISALAAPLESSPDIIPVDPGCHTDQDGYFIIEIKDEDTHPGSTYTYRINLDGNLVDEHTWDGALVNSIKLGPGTYVITFIEHTSTGNITLGLPRNLTLVAPNPIQLNVNDFSAQECSTDLNYIKLSASGGTPPYTYALNYGTADEITNNDGNFDNLPAGRYTPSVTDANNCARAYANTITIEAGQKIEPANVQVMQPECAGDGAQILITGLPINQNLYEISLNENTSFAKFVDGANVTLTNVPAGTYTLEINSTTCTSGADDYTHPNIVIESFDAVSLVPTPGTGHVLTCGGDETVDITVAVNGGKAGKPVSVVLDNNNGISSDDRSFSTSYGGDDVTIPGVKVGNYTLRWIDGDNNTCTGSIPYSIVGPANAINAKFLNKTNPSCHDAFDGIIQLDVSGGSGDYQYSFDNGSSYTELNDDQKIYVGAGTYDITVKDSEGCTDAIEDAITITSPPQLVANLVSGSETDATCPEKNDGSFQIHVEGGDGAYRYAIYEAGGFPNDDFSSISDLATIGGLAVGDYTVSVTDGNECGPVDFNVSIGGPNPLSITSLGFDSIVCPGTVTSIVVSASGGAPSPDGYTYQLLRGVDDVLDEVETKTIIGPYSFDNITPSTYTLRVWSSTVCVSIDTTFTIESSKPIQIINKRDSIMVQCSNQTASVQILASGKAPMTYILGASDTGPALPFAGTNPYGDSYVTLTDLQSETAATDGFSHTLFIYDANGCKKEFSFKVYAPEPLAIKNVVSQRISANGANDGKITFTVSGGVAGYSAQLINAATSAVYRSYSSDSGNFLINGIRPGEYTLKVIDSNGCELTSPDGNILIEQPEVLNLDIDPATLEALCFGDILKVQIDVTGGWPEEEVHVRVFGHGIDTTIQSNSALELPYVSSPSTQYTAVLTQGEARPVTRYFSITGPTKLQLAVPEFHSVSCSGESDGQIVMRVQGGTPGYQYGLGGTGTASTDFTVDGQNRFTIEGVDAGTINLVVQDANECSSDEFEVVITEPDPVVFNEADIRVDSVVCYGEANGRIIVGTVSGGSGSYQYKLMQGGADVKPLQNSNVFSGLSAGRYQVYVYDTKGCESENSGVEVDVKQPELININGADITSEITCHNLSDAVITIEASGGNPYGLEYKVTGKTYQEDNSLTGLSAGTYNIYVRDERGKCESVWPNELIIVNPPKLELINGVKTDVVCHNEKNGTISIDATGGTGDYVYNLYEDENLAQDPKMVGYFEGLGDISERQASYVNYTVLVNDANGCEDEQSFTITNPEKLIVSYIDHHQVKCNGQNNGWIKVGASGGTGDYAFKKHYTQGSTTSDVTSIDNANFVIERYSGGDFRPMIIDDNGCTDTLAETINIVDPPKLILANVIPGVKNCNYSTDDSTIFVIDPVNCGTAGAYEFSINDGDTWKKDDSIFVNVRTEVIYPKVRDIEGCEASFESLGIEWPQAYNVNITKNEIRCWDRQYGTLSVEMTGGTTPYYVSVNNPTFPENTNTTFKIEFDDTYNTVRDTIGDGFENVFQYDTPYYIYIKDNNGCYAQNLDVQSIEDRIGPYEWEPTDTLTLVSIDPTRPKCAGKKGSIYYTVKDGAKPYRYWVQDQLGTDNVIPTLADENGLVQVPTGITLYAFVTDRYNCTPRVPDNLEQSYLTTFINPINDTVKVEWEMTKVPFCPETKDGRMELEVADMLEGGATYEIYKLDTIRLYDTVYWEYPTLPEFIDEVHKDEFSDSMQVQLEGIDGIDYTEWMYTVSKYLVPYKFKYGQYKIVFFDNITECDVSYEMYIPYQTEDCPDIFTQVFTPNNDGQNDLWEVSPYEKSNVKLQIFTAYGELVYEFEGLVPEEGLTWDGLDYRGRPVQAGTYMYIYQPDVKVDKSDMQCGNITLLRKR